MKRVPVQAAAMAKKLLLGLVALTALAWPSEVVAQGFKATVLSIGDGDTIRVRQAGKALTVRLACIDAPETAQSPYGQQARTYLQQRLPIGREVSLNIKTTDRYGRSVGCGQRNLHRGTRCTLGAGGNQGITAHPLVKRFQPGPVLG